MEAVRFLLYLAYLKHREVSTMISLAPPTVSMDLVPSPQGRLR
jgi:hypothetical protein